MEFDEEEIELIKCALSCLESEWSWNWDEKRRNLFEAVWSKLHGSIRKVNKNGMAI